MASKQNLVSLFKESAGMSPESQAYAQAYGEFPSTNTYGNGGQFRIVRDELWPAGFRVQVETYGRRNSDNFGPHWRDIGRKLYSVDAAREYRAFLERHNGRADISVEVVE